MFSNEWYNLDYEYILATFIVIAVAFSALAIGLILRNKPIEGSCGGVMTSEDGTCSICGKQK